MSGPAVSGSAVRATAPFVLPEEPDAAAAIAAIREELALFDDEEGYYDYIIDQGRKLPRLPPDWQDDAHRLKGCLAQVWLEGERTEAGHLVLAGGSDSTIVAGLVRLVLRVYSGRTPDEILATDPVFLKELGLIRSLTQNRSNGVDSMARAILERARAAKVG